MPGVIYLDSTSCGVEEQLVEVLKRVLSHLQVAINCAFRLLKLALTFDLNRDHFAGSALNRRIRPVIWPLT